MLTYKNWAESPRSVHVNEEVLEFGAEELKAAYAYWTSCACGAIPRKNSLSPKSMTHFLGHVAIFEKRPGSQYHIRLMGTHLTSVIGEMQGRTVMEALPPEAAWRWTTALDSVIESRRPRCIISHIAVGRLEYLNADIFLAPLLDDNGVITMVLGVAAFAHGIQPPNEKAETRAYASTSSVGLPAQEAGTRL